MPSPRQAAALADAVIGEAQGWLRCCQSSCLDGRPFTPPAACLQVVCLLQEARMACEPPVSNAVRQLCAARLIAGIDAASKAPGPAQVAPTLLGTSSQSCTVCILSCTAHMSMLCCSVQDTSLFIVVLSQMRRCSHCRRLQQEKPVQRPTRQMASRRVTAVTAQMMSSWLTFFATLQISRTLRCCPFA